MRESGSAAFWRRLALAVGCGVALPAAAAEKTVCAAGERTAFACRTRKDQLASVCLRSDSQVVYRFGKPGAIDLEFPKGAAGGNSGFRLNDTAGAGSSEDDLSFQIGEYSYTVADISTWQPGPDSAGSRDGTIIVERAGHAPVRLVCRPLEGEGWEILEKVLPQPPGAK